MNDDSDSENDLEDISLQEEWVNENCSPAQLWRLSYDIEDGTVVKDEIERAMEYYCYLWERQQVPPRELTILLVTIFRKYLRGRKSNKPLEAAFGFKGKQGGNRNKDQRNLDIATGIAQLVLANKNLDFCLDSAIHEWSLGRTIIEEIWKRFRSEAISRVRIKLQENGEDFTEKQKDIALKVLKKETRLIERHNKKLGE